MSQTEVSVPDGVGGWSRVPCWAACGTTEVVPFPGFTRRWSAALPRCCRVRWAGSDVRTKIKITVKIKGNGQECPFHTGSAAEAGFLFWLLAARLKSCPSRALRGAEAPLFHGAAGCGGLDQESRSGSDRDQIKIKGNGQECPFHTGCGDMPGAPGQLRAC